MALEAPWILNQDAEPCGTTLIDAHNGFNKLSRLEMLQTLRHHWPAGTRFAFNCYKHWAQILLHQPGDAPVILLIREGVTQVDPLLMVLYGITLAPLAEDLRDMEPTLLPPFYFDDAAFDGSVWWSAAQLRLLMDRGLGRGYFHKPSKYIFY